MVNLQELDSERVEQEAQILAELTCQECQEEVLRIAVDSFDGSDTLVSLLAQAKLRGWKYNATDGIVLGPKCANWHKED